jgi:uncharacterized protein YndB with AHSA1/START domain
LTGQFLAGDTARASVSVAVEPALAFEIFTRDIDRWWLRGVKFRHAGRQRGFICMESGVGGRLFESVDGHEAAALADAGQTRPYVIEVGQVSVWDPPQRLVFSWRNANYAPGEHTEVEVGFTATARGTLVTVTHRGLASLRPDHPARHGLESEAFIRMTGLWWGEQMSSLREFSNASAKDQG